MAECQLADSLQQKLKISDGIRSVPCTADFKSLRKLLIDDITTKVVLFPEGNYTFSVAFAALRGSWDGIEPVMQYKPDFSDLHMLYLEYIESCIEDGKKLDKGSTATLLKVKSILCLPPQQVIIASCIESHQALRDESTAAIINVARLPPPPVHTCLHNIHTVAHRTVDVDGKVVWFQCPLKSQNLTSERMGKFLADMASKQSANDYVLIGILNSHQNREEGIREVNKVIDEVKDVGTYKCICRDTTVIKAILRHGYCLEEPNDQHFNPSQDHVTLVFQRAPIKINYKNVTVNKATGVKEFLIDPATKVVFFGEGNFTFSVAFAALRGSWDGITSTRYEPIHVTDHKPEPVFLDVQVLTIEYCIKNGRKLRDDPATTRQAVDKLLRVPTTPEIDWRYGIDATSNELGVQGKVVWFQCPWNSYSTETLITRFLEHMAKKQTYRDYLLIGITTRPEYVQKYALDQFITDGEFVGTLQYSFVGADQTLIRDILRHGYYHQGVKNIHGYIFEHHV